MRVSCLAAALLVACGSADARTALVTIDTLPGGIPRTITTQPVEAGMWQAVLERSVQPALGSPGELLDPQDLALGDDGTLYLVEGNPAVVNVYDPSGTFVRSIGRQGEGPGEFSVGFIALRGDTLVLQDPRQSRATIYLASTGEVLSIRPTTCCFWSPIAIDARGRAWLPMMTPPDSGGGAPIRSFLTLALGETGADTALVAQDPAVADEPRWHVTGANGRMQFSMTVPMHPRAHEEVDPTGGLVTGYAARYALRRTTNGRDTVALFGRPFDPVPVTDAERQALVDTRVARQLQSGNAVDEIALRKAFDASLIPDHRPAFQRIYVDRGGRVLVMRALPDSMAVHLDLFDRAGVWLDEVVVPEPEWARQPYTSVAFSRDRLAIIGEDADGLPVVRIYRIERRKD